MKVMTRAKGTQKQTQRPARDTLSEARKQAGETVQFGEGAFRPNPDMAPDANTTGLVIAALVAAGENPRAQAVRCAVRVDGGFAPME